MGDRNGQSLAALHHNNRHIYLQVQATTGSTYAMQKTRTRYEQASDKVTLRLETAGGGTDLNGRVHLPSALKLRSQTPYNLVPTKEGSTGEGPAALVRQGVTVSIAPQ